jgi:hypothetical protein
LIRKNSRILFLYFAVFSLMLWFSASVPAQGDQPIKIILNGKELKTDVPPEIKDGRTMVPIRAIAEGLGMEVAWDEAADLIISAMEKTIASKVVTYDFARLMEGAIEVKTSRFGDELIKNL